MAGNGLGGFVISALIFVGMTLVALYVFFDLLGFQSANVATGAGSAH